MTAADAPAEAAPEQPTAETASKDPAESPAAAPAEAAAHGEAAPAVDGEGQGGDGGEGASTAGGAGADGAASGEGDGAAAEDQPTVEEEEEEEEEEEPLPEGAEYVEVTPKAIFLAGASQEIFECVQDKDVTADKPEKRIPIQKIKDDMIARAAVSDFSVVKDEMKKYKGEEVLIVLDPDFKYGENFFMFTTEEHKAQWELNARIKRAEERAAIKAKKKKKGGDGGGDEDDDEDETDDEDDEPEVKAERPKEWISLGSEAEVDAGIWRRSQKPLKILLSRRRRYFGAPVELADRPAPVPNEGEEDGEIELPPDSIEWRTAVLEEDDPEPVYRRRIDGAIQAVPVTSDAHAQTHWLPKRNRAIQYVPLTEETAAGPDTVGTTVAVTAEQLVDQKKVAEAEREAKLAVFLKTVYPTVKIALDENEHLGLFQDDYGTLKEASAEPVLLSQQQSTLQEHQSFKFVDTPYEEAVSCVAWHPTIPEIFAVALTRKDEFSDRVEHTLRGTPGMVAVWNMQSPIEPRLLLKAPEEILWVDFSPTTPSLVAGGCINGQLIIWDISKTYMAALSQKITASTNEDLVGGSLFDDSNRQIPILGHVVSSSIEHSHGSAITQLMWIPPHLELSKSGRPVPMEEDKPREKDATQLMTMAADTNMLVWDLRPDKVKFSMAILKTLDLSWRPLFKVFVAQGSDDTADNGGVCFITRPMPTAKAPAQDAASDAQQTMVFVGTERGNLLYLDWRAKELDNGKLGVQDLERGMLVHAGPVAALSRSPFDADLVLSVGGMGVTVWKEGLWAGPILTASTKGQARATAAEWSPSRPGVFYVGKADGTVDVWDLMDTTYAPALVVNVCSPIAVSRFVAQHCAAAVARPYVAVGDDNGVVHIMEVPPGYATPSANEAERLHTFVEAEAHRLEYVAARMDHRATAAAADDAAAALPPRDEEEPALTEAEEEEAAAAAEEQRLAAEVDDMLGQFEREERAFLESMGLAEPEPETSGED